MTVLDTPREIIERFTTTVHHELKCDASAVACVNAQGGRTFLSHRGYTEKTLRFFAGPFVRNDRGYRTALKDPKKVFDWDTIPSYRGGEAVKNILEPDGFEQGTSIPLISSSQTLVGELHLNIASPVFSERLIETISTQVDWLADVVEAAALRQTTTLTVRQIDVLELVVAGRSSREIADQLVISSRTVEAHMNQIMNILQVRTRVQAVIKALQLGLVDLYGRRPARGIDEAPPAGIEQIRWQ